MSEERRIDPAVAAYKAYLRDLINARPSGLRGRLALLLGKHKSFVSQITSPNYPAPIPQAHIGTILLACQLNDREHEQFFALYRKAHGGSAGPASKVKDRPLSINIPDFEYPETRRGVEAAIMAFAQDTIALARTIEQAPKRHHQGSKR